MALVSAPFFSFKAVISAAKVVIIQVHGTLTAGPGMMYLNSPISSVKDVIIKS